MTGVMALISGTPLGGNILFHYTLKDIVLYIFQVMYFILATYYTGTTIGKRLMNLRVVPANRKEKLSFVDVLYRETVGRFLCNISVCIGYILIGIDKEKRGIHDMLCDTRVVYEKKVKVYPVYQRPPMPPVPPQQPMPPVPPSPVPPQQQQPSHPIQENVSAGNIHMPLQKPEPPQHGQFKPQRPEGGSHMGDKEPEVTEQNDD